MIAINAFVLIVLFALAVSILLAVVMLFKVMKKINKQIPDYYYFLGPAIFTRKFIGEDGWGYMKIMWRSVFVMVACIVVLSAVYPFPN